MEFYDAKAKEEESLDATKIKVQFDPNDPGKSLSDMFGAISRAIGEKLSEVDSEDDEEEASEPSEPAKKASDKPKKKTKAEYREELTRLYNEGKLDDELIFVQEEKRSVPIVMGSVGAESMPEELRDVLENMAPKRRTHREFKVSEARDVIVEQESERLLDKDKINERAIELAENLGIIFIDEIDKIVGSEGGRGADVSRQGVQRDLLPIVEGTTVQTKCGLFSTEHVLFIAAGAFHRVKPSDLTPELQGRFPIRVELSELKKEDFVRILTEPKSALTKQYAALMKTENVELVFKDDAIDALAEYAAQTNLTTQNIGARRLCTIMELLLEDLNFEAAEMESGRVEIDAEYVRSKIDKIAKDEDLSKFVL
ncbi:MAG: AAA family ATPase [Thermoguttaceae bacterium]|nr:AAA family ATPase [Thermoguttaceae bacterium]